MKNTRRIFLILLIVVVFACGLALWAGNSPIVEDYQVIHKRDTENHLVMAFATALRINHPAAYDMVDPSLNNRLNEWMNVHQSKKCIVPADYFNVSYGTKVGKSISFGCAIENYLWFSYKVDNIVIKDMKVIDWGEVKEE